MAREISKIYEEILHKDLGSLNNLLAERVKAGRVKGEFTVVIGPSREGKKQKKMKKQTDADEEDDD
jgi:16S rRNA C1402 (ribose-2'-O) methylase RsmI